ncbi:threonine transporter RhtB [Enterovibrio norvegicus FF-33]|uniref:LysE family translocator n=1 Tax=Enterovibrio norvegicus TaxID=188144 RepID=UPI0002E43280|nr:LysE family translocator [Enterovibrio norvegicus]OEE66102.1 threonine transporter RhtB [Enterovibrio norvegicus FF-33]
MSLFSGFALFLALLLSVIIPGPSVMAVVSRSLSFGMKQGFMVVLGVLVADYIFICLALSGLSAVATAMGEFSVFLKYAGATYLIWLAYKSWTSPTSDSDLTAQKASKAKGTSSFAMGLVTTLSNPKAILFYMGFFPAFIDVQTLSGAGILAVLILSTIAVGGVLSGYAILGDKATRIFNGKKAKARINKVSGGILAACGVALAIKI